MFYFFAHSQIILPVRIPEVNDDEVPGRPGVYPGVDSPVHGEIPQCPIARVQLVIVAGVELDLSCVTCSIVSWCVSNVTLIPVLLVASTAEILSANMRDLLAIFIPACT